MNYAQIRKYDVANGPGLRTTIFVTGCTHNCKECFNKEYQDFNFGDPWTEKETEMVKDYLNQPEVAGLTVLGGEPFQNVEGLVPVLKEIRKSTNKDIWIFSGDTFETIKADEKKFELLKLCDVLVDGPFVNELKDLRLKFRGSSNQRIIKIKDSIEKDKVVLWEE